MGVLDRALAKLINPPKTNLSQSKINEIEADNVDEMLFSSPGTLDDPLLRPFSSGFVPLTLPMITNAQASPGVGFADPPIMESAPVPTETRETNTATEPSTSKVLQFAGRADQPAPIDFTQLIIFGAIAAFVVPLILRGR